MEHITMRLVPGGTIPLYRQLYTCLVAEMRSGNLAAGEKLPGKRAMAQQLGVSVNTVDTAYQMLVAEGYLKARPRSGFAVRALLPGVSAAQTPPRTADLTDLPVQEKALAATPSTPVLFDFQTASIDTTLFPFKTWRRLQRDLLAGNPSLLNHGHRQGDENLRRAIATYLHEFRGARCDAGQIVVGAGIEYLLGLLACLFKEDVFAVENPGYARTARILQNSGVRSCCVAVDSEGLSAQALAQSGATLAYVTPSHQFPTGVSMPAGRRDALLQWARETPGRYLIEDDYDSEFRFDVRPLPCLQGMDDGAHVIYISTFSKSIAPAIRIAYMVLPPALLARYTEQFAFYSSTVSRFEQQTLCRFMEGGHFARHLNRLRNAYRQRRDALVDALHAAFGRSALEILGSHTGLHLLVRLRTGLDETQMIERAAAHGARLTGLSAYYRANPENCPASTVVLGYAGVPPDAILPAVAALRAAW